MDERLRDELIDRYYACLDDEAYAPLSDVFSPTATHERPGQRPLVGGEAIAAFFEAERRSSATTHRVVRRFHAPDVTVCKVDVEGRLPEGPFEGTVMAEFEFDEVDGTIATYRVYRGYER